jgi:predicted DNA-binding transcriptional regulator AlpA
MKSKNSLKPPSTPSPIGRLLGYPDLQQIFGLSRRTIERQVSQGRFPRPLKVGGAARWREETVRRHLDRLEAEAR